MHRLNYTMYEGKVDRDTEDRVWVGKEENVQHLAQLIVDKLERDRYLKSQDEPWLDLACIGWSSLNQAVKAIAVARELVGPGKHDLVMQPAFSTIVDFAEQERTRIILRVFRVKT